MKPNFKEVTTSYYDRVTNQSVEYRYKSFINMDMVQQVCDAEKGSTIVFENGSTLSVKESYGALLND